MNVFFRRFALGAGAFVLIGVTIESVSPVRVGLVNTAVAIVGVAPGGSVVRRRTVYAATTNVAASSANASAAATANANAEAAAASANAAASTAQAAGPPPVGTTVTTLPPGCAATTINGVEYQRCGTTYYKPSMMGSNLVFVVAQP
jgi:hypothetical protein